MAAKDQSAALKLEHARGDGGSVIRLHGVINESFDKARFVRAVDEVTVVDMDGVTQVTSFGVREWKLALENAPFSYLGFIRCRPAVVAQFNMVVDFGGRGEL